MLLETERLTIVHLTMDMAQRIHELSMEDDVRRYVPDEVFETVDAAAEAIAFLMKCYDGQYCPLVFAVQLKQGECIGYVQLVPMKDGTWEIGYHIGRQYTGCGYATEAVKAFLPAIMQRLNLTAVWGICTQENAASMRVLQKSGFVQVFCGAGEYQGKIREIGKFIFNRN